MAFPTIAATNTYTTGTDATDHIVPLPASIAAGELLLIWFANDGPALPATPSGWNRRHLSIGLSNVMVSTLFWKIAAGSDSNPTIVLSSSDSASAISMRISGYGRFITGGATPQAASTDVVINPLNVIESEEILWIAFGSWDAGRTLSSYPSGYSSNQVNAGSAAVSVGVAAAAKQLESASDSPGPFVIATTDQTDSVLVAVLPPSVGGGGSTPTYSRGRIVNA